MIWDETRWDSKVREKWGKPSTDEAIAGNIQDYLDQLNSNRGDERSDYSTDEVAA